MTPAFSALAGLLDDLAAVVASLSDDEFCRRPGGAASGSIGQHVRHCLDHVFAFEQALRTHMIDYDQRCRGTSIERDRRAAIAALQAATARLAAFDDRWLCSLVQVRSQLTRHGRTIEATSSVGRELAFVIAHTIHHSALINVLLQHGGSAVPDGFGFAPSTPRPDVALHPAS